MAGLAVTAAEPSGLWGLLKESMAGGWSLLEAKNAPGDGLARAIATDFGQAKSRSAARDRVQKRVAGVKLPDLKNVAVAAVREAAALVDAKAPADAPAFKEWLRKVAQATADASSEGGFLGFGGVKVSPAEQAALNDIAGALGLQAAVAAAGAPAPGARGVEPGSPRLGP
jgi:hypothetical protein